MAARIEEYVAAGYFLSRLTDRRDCTGIELRRITLASDHSQRRFFPESWTLSWCRGSREERLQSAAVFGIAEADFDGVISWADQSFDSAFGAWNVLFTLEGGRAAARSFLRNAVDVELWGVGLHRSLVPDFCKASAPRPQVPGYAPEGASGLHVATCVRPAPLAAGGVVLGHEILVAELGGFNSPESRHLDERAEFRAAGVIANDLGLIDSFEDALACSRFLDARAFQIQHGITGWLPWLLVRYSL